MLTSNRISNGTELNDLLGRLGLPGGLAGARFDQLRGDRAGMLANLRDAWVEARHGRGTTGVERRAAGAMAPSMAVPPPWSQMPMPGTPAAGGYWDSTLDLAQGRPLDLSDPMRRRQAAFERRLRRDPQLRARFERRIGGRIMFDGRNDGVLRVRRCAQRNLPPMAGIGAMPPMAGIGAMPPMAGIGHMDRAILEQLGQMAGLGVGGAQPGYSNYLLEGLGQAHGDASSIMSDPSLTVEDKVMLVLMMMMRKMDQEIEGQTNRLTQLQQNGAQGQGGGQGGAPSIDLETQKLERMVTKRQQMFDTLRHIMEKYAQTAKGVIDSIGR